MAGGTLIGHLKARSGVILAADQSACELLGLDPEVAPGADIRFLAMPCLDDGPALTPHFSACDHRAIRKVGPEAGRTVVVSCRSEPGRPGEGRLCDLVLLDASDPADIIHRIILAKHEIEEIFDTSPWLSLVCDAEMRVVRANRALVRELGLRFCDLIDRPAETVLENLGSTEAMETARKCLALGSPVTVELTAGGKLFVLDAAPIERSHEESMVLLRYRDVTRERAMEAKLMHWDRLRHIGELAAGIAHEAVTPVSYIGWNLERLERFAQEAAKASPELAGSAAEALELARESQGGVVNLKKMLKDLRAFSHPGDRSPEVGTLEECMERALTLSGTKLREGVRLMRLYCGDQPSIPCHPYRLTQVFINLIANALDAMEGTGTLTVSTGMNENTEAWAEVGDTGSGIDPEDIPRVFDAFFTTKPSAGGTGLGLALSRMIISAHGGDITIKSGRGEGTVFRVSIPLPYGEVQPS